MLTSRLLQLTVAILPRLAAAGSDPAAAYGTVAPPSLDLPDAVSNASSTIESEALLEECDPSITVCGTTANVKVVRTHNSTIFVTRHHVHEEITELPTSTRTVVEVIVSTNTTNIEGQCRDTTVYVEPTPLIVTVDVNTTTTREVVPIVNITSVTTSWVEHKKISQCIIKRTSTGLAPGPSYSSAPPPPSAPSQQSPPAAGSGGNYNSGQPAPSVPSAGASSAQGSGSQSSAPSSSSQSSSSTSESVSGSIYGSASGSFSRASGASAGSSASGASRASGASSSSSSSTSRSTP
ncbi:uncharacterized protein FFB20_09903 [Fusarium fujikuroi]|uniref:GEgh 16 protein n=1 Tax=Gibberella fujikuroi (strain CBS 195.34 / IMI 58289 / NRRL A-6831) TaxID=1279085 RepID=S0E1E8_GIBF5|nr:uncharacterized protein FFUJ_03538 [Fusarium fujikuroi IMI 58289]KLP06786.1 uncharacterized protein Y057_11230 [Fusarium fujikuroi]KLP14233.1 uncharacterized protein LW94_644 [Fusarium fujikuroi]QGI62695.1 hypothetical protein CEK27_006666 [Fusarium fujikuroi]QGI79861.1 hypothetical protein CEK25_006590 [Fusarium fujikuroi]QGI93587.1 hypothetical protein CEK26_006656 [Fusarium fujikuroi]